MFCKKSWKKKKAWFDKDAKNLVINAVTSAWMGFNSCFKLLVREDQNEKQTYGLCFKNWYDDKREFIGYNAWG